MSEFSPFWAKMRDMKLVTTKSWIKSRGHCPSFYPAHLPAVRAVSKGPGVSRNGVKNNREKKFCGRYPAALTPTRKN